MSGLLENRLLQFSASVVQLVGDIPAAVATRNIVAQLLKSATSIGANYEEASGAESRADFIHKMHIAFKESRETCYWLRLLEQANIISHEQIQPITEEALQIRAMLTAALNTAKFRNGS